jgi:hypothetical protein
MKFYAIEDEFKVSYGKSYDGQAIIAVDDDQEIMDGITEFGTEPNRLIGTTYQTGSGDEISKDLYNKRYERWCK